MRKVVFGNICSMIDATQINSVEEKRCCLGLTFVEITNSPIGPISFASGEHGLQGVAFSNLEEYKATLNQPDETPTLAGWETANKLLVEMNAYLSGLQREFTVDIDWSYIQGFQLQVLRITYEIPFGQVMSYGAIANQLGKPGAARAVGTALARNPIPIVIPCHRVIGSDHGLHGFGGGLDVKAYLLKLEGHTVINHRVIQP
ncbi:MAG: methylated-DNA--[protein]-cysteine S-methyltransferase [Brevefilum fermentans]|uniref:Methylated-DNA--protein-cysteine methyltransferase n=1 Tax=Candidatus Brevifilum fermentans TaxID=1986204 RepID=A0A1Y6K4R2_9CHLR|nr:Methylated-DNA--protein-cysteine methyltransferase [Brevefilum fermentans]